LLRLLLNNTKYGLIVAAGYCCFTVLIMAVASLCHDNQRHLKAMQFVVHFLDNSEAFFDAEVNQSVCINYIAGDIVHINCVS